MGRMWGARARARLPLRKMSGLAGWALHPPGDIGEDLDALPRRRVSIARLPARCLQPRPQTRSRIALRIIG